MFRSVLYYMLAALIFMYCSACLKQSPEYPARIHDPGLPVNAEVDRLIQLSIEEGIPYRIDSDWTVAVIVRADDASGNFYKEIVVEDRTAGIALQVNASALHTRYPVGRKLYIRLKGLYLGNHYGTYQLGAYPVVDNYGVLQVSPVTPKEMTDHIVPAGFPEAYAPLPVRLEDLQLPQPAWTNRLLYIQDVELDDPYKYDVFAEPDAALSIPLKDCNGFTILLRTSQHAVFRSARTPSGKGSVTAIYSIYKGKGQLVIRDTTDIRMNQSRCDGTVPGPASIISIARLRSWYRDRDTVIGNYVISGVVTSLESSRNFSAGTIIVQDSSAGVMVYMGSTSLMLPDMGDSVQIYLAGSVLTKYNGALEIKDISSGKVKLCAVGLRVLPLDVDNIAVLQERFTELESRLVRLNDVRMSGGTNYGGTRSVTDTTGTILLYTSYNASFASSPLPFITKSIQAIVTPYNATKELKIRHPDLDVD